MESNDGKVIGLNLLEERYKILDVRHRWEGDVELRWADGFIVKDDTFQSGVRDGTNIRCK